MNQVLINDKGELLEILQEPKEPQDDEHIVPLDGYYEVFNEQRYSQAKWDFKLKKWVGVGEQRPIIVPIKSEIEQLKEVVDQLLIESLGGL